MYSSPWFVCVCHLPLSIIKDQKNDSKENGVKEGKDSGTAAENNDDKVAIMHAVIDRAIIPDSNSYTHIMANMIQKMLCFVCIWNNKQILENKLILTLDWADEQCFHIRSAVPSIF